MAENIDAEREAVARAICGACGEVPDHKGDARGNAFRWQDYLDVADAAIAARRTPSASIGEDGLPNLPTLPQSLLNSISYYGMARTDGKTDTDRLELWNDLISAIKHYAAEFARDAVAADRRARAESPQASQGVKTWRDRMIDLGMDPADPSAYADARRKQCRDAEIADLRAQLASAQQAKEYEQRHAVESEKALAQVQAQLARQSQDNNDMAAEMKRLHDALCFWLPQSRAELPDAMQERIAADAYLLVGYDDMSDPKSAEELGWIVAAPPLSSEQQTGKTCRSCKRLYTKTGRINAAGHCPHCGVEIAEGA